MKRLALSLGLLSLAAVANAALFLRETPDARPEAGTARVILGSISLDVPRAFIREPGQKPGGTLSRLDLAFAAHDFAPMPPPSARDPLRQLPDRLGIVLAAVGDRLGPAEHFQMVHARFLTAETEAGPGGLLRRRFRAGTPYADRDLYIGAGTGKLFLALCPRDLADIAEPCMATFRHEGLDIDMRFPPRMVGDWRRLSSEFLTRLAGWKGAP